MKKANKDSIGKKRLQIEEEYKISKSTALNQIKAIAKKSAAITTAQIPEKKFDKLYKLLYDPNLLYQAMEKISKSEGALTIGPPLDKTTADNSSSKLIENISNELKSETFRFKPIRRIYIDKTGKNRNINDQIKDLKDKSPEAIKLLKARPLGIPAFKDKIVQEAIRIILNAIYEPEFAKANYNFGFRSGLGCHDAIYNIQRYSKAMKYAIEGDIKGAFDNVKFSKLEQILEKKIKDRRFIKLIINGLKCGIIFDHQKTETTIGTTQGSVVSPILFNIYMHEFDLFVKNELSNMIDQKNKNEYRTDRPIHKLYNYLSKTKSKLKFKHVVEDLKNTYTQQGKNSLEFKKKYEKFLITRLKYKNLTKEQFKYPAFSKRRQTIRFSYTRYADDWILTTNSTLQYCEEIKETIAKWIETNLELTLSPEKTKITNLDKGKATFLGFQLSNADPLNKKISNISNKRIFKKDIALRRKKTTYIVPSFSKVFKQRSTNPTLITAWDRQRVLSRLQDKRFIKKYKNNWRGCSKTEWTVLNAAEIIERYNYVMRGYLLYYAPVLTYATDVHQLYYLLKFSCAHTLSNKFNTTLKSIFKKHKENLTVKYNIKQKHEDNTGKIIEISSEKTVSILSWEQCLTIIRDSITRFRKRINHPKKTDDNIINTTVDRICDIKINWRTQYKLTSHCSICGSLKDVQMHHIKHIRKGKVIGFAQIMKQLNRKQIPCCRLCHQKIHNGQYDGLKLSDLYDIELIVI